MHFKLVLREVLKKCSHFLDVANPPDLRVTGKLAARDFNSRLVIEWKGKKTMENRFPLNSAQVTSYNFFPLDVTLFLAIY